MELSFDTNICLMYLGINEMKLKNKYQKFSKISEPQFRQILRLFALDLTASDTARLTGINVRSINTLFLRLYLHRNIFN